MSNNKITEKEYLEMAQDCKNRIEEKNNELIRKNKEIHNIKCKLTEIFGLFRKLKKIFIGISQIDSNIGWFFDEINRDLHDILFPELETEEINIDINLDLDDMESVSTESE